MAECAMCGGKMGMFGKNKVGNMVYCDNCADKAEAQLRERENLEKSLTPEMMEKIVITTTPSVDGRQITAYKGVVNAQVVLSVNFFKDMLASVKSTLGGRSGTLERELERGYAGVVTELKKKAITIGADGVVGVSITSSLEMAGDSGSNDKMMLVSGTGTAIKFG